MKVGDLVILSDRQSIGLIVGHDKNAYRILVDEYKLTVLKTQVWKVISESR